MDQIKTTLTVTNDTDKRGQQILSLIQNNIQGFASSFYDWRTIGTSYSDFKLPTVLVVPVSQNPMMFTTGKYRVRFNFDIYWFCSEESLDTIPVLNTFIAETLIKLFSNNALGDGTPRYKNNPGYWFNSEMNGVDYGRAFLNPEAEIEGGRFLQVGRMSLMVEDQITK